MGNPINYIDPNGMFVAPPGDFYNLKGKKIGTDGKDDGAKYIVVDNAEAKEVKNTQGNVDLANLNSAVQVSEGILNQADAAVEGQDDTGFEHGFVAATDGSTSSLLNNNAEGAVSQAPGFDELEAAGKTTAFTVHTHPDDITVNADGSYVATVPEPSGTAGSVGANADYNYRGLKERQGKVTNANSWVIGTRSTPSIANGNLTISKVREVSFYNNAGTSRTMKWKTFRNAALKVIND